MGWYLSLLGKANHFPVFIIQMLISFRDPHPDQYPRNNALPNIWAPHDPAILHRKLTRCGRLGYVPKCSKLSSRYQVMGGKSKWRHLFQEGTREEKMMVAIGNHSQDISLEDWLKYGTRDGEGENLMDSGTNLWRKVSEEQKDLAKNSDRQYHWWT